MPRLNAKLPITLAKTTTSVMTAVFKWNWLVTRVGRDRWLTIVRHELLALLAKRHVLPRFLGQPLSLGGIEDRLPDDAPDHSRPEVVFSVKPLDPVHKFGAVETRVDHRRKLVAHFIGH